MPELIWKGKYDDSGQLAGPPRVALPFQTVNRFGNDHKMGSR